DAITPFYDDTLDRRISETLRDWRSESNSVVEETEEYEIAAHLISEILERSREIDHELREVQGEAFQAIAAMDLDIPELEIPEPEIEYDPPEPIFTTDDD